MGFIVIVVVLLLLLLLLLLFLLLFPSTSIHSKFQCPVWKSWFLLPFDFFGWGCFFLKNVVLFCLPFSLQRVIFLVFFFLFLTVTEAILGWYRVWEAENTYVTCLQSIRSVLGVIQFDVAFHFIALIVALTWM